MEYVDQNTTNALSTNTLSTDALSTDGALEMDSATSEIKLMVCISV